MRILGILVFCLSFIIVAQGKGNLTFEKANQLYHNKEYGRALELYNQLINNGFSSPDLYYNTGNAYFKKNKIGLAIWAYKNSLALEHRRNTHDNYLLARSKIQLPIAEQEEIFFLRWWKFIYSFLSMNQWAILSLISFLVAIALLFNRKWRNIEPLMYPLIKVLLIVSGVSFFFMGVNRYEEATNCLAVVVKNTSFGSTKNLSEMQKISEGIEVQVMEKVKGPEKRNILKVKLPNSKEAWMLDSDLKLVN